MPKAHRDSKGYYEILGVRPTASDDEIRLAYALLKGSEDSRTEHGVENDAITRAYEFLKNPGRRQAYDRAETESKFSFSVGFKLNDPRLLAVCLALLLAILGLVWVPLYASRFRSFSAGDRLIDERGSEFGVVVQSDERHLFHGGVAAPAYLVETSPGGELRWYPAADLQGTCRRAK
ncbi:MAG TPA: DnaJ domain-containing protein [Candidatus Polarisedimenticolia bacterium]|jgi:hypothetical protein